MDAYQNLISGDKPPAEYKVIVVVGLSALLHRSMYFSRHQLLFIKCTDSKKVIPQCSRQSQHCFDFEKASLKELQLNPQCADKVHRRLV